LSKTFSRQIELIVLIAGFSHLTSLTIRTHPEDTFDSLLDEDVEILSGKTDLVCMWLAAQVIESVLIFKL
jgi:hypothetical protein